ncbi:PREDICTED: UPF0317 protein KRH_21160-like, partial [Chinchilla lanigera]|uniref:UPF0317 protein KRH_21160-like n=1 Tax=Chinchilla lanigera TaxID=34839 RepID=UPI00069635B7
MVVQFMLSLVEQQRTTVNPALYQVPLEAARVKRIEVEKEEGNFGVCALVRNLFWLTVMGIIQPSVYLWLYSLGDEHRVRGLRSRGYENAFPFADCDLGTRLWGAVSPLVTFTSRWRPAPFQVPGRCAEEPAARLRGAFSRVRVLRPTPRSLLSRPRPARPPQRSGLFRALFPGKPGRASPAVGHLGVPAASQSPRQPPGAAPQGPGAGQRPPALVLRAGSPTRSAPRSSTPQRRRRRFPAAPPRPPASCPRGLRGVLGRAAPLRPQRRALRGESRRPALSGRRRRGRAGRPDRRGGQQ